jgi:hypothetical protein
MVIMILESVKKFILCIVVFIVGAQMTASEKDDAVPYIVYAKEIMNSFIEQSEKEYHLDCISTGGRFAKNVGKIEINFIAYRKGTIDEARTLEVKMIDALLKRINDHEKIRPFLAEYPFKEKDIDISIAFRKADNSRYNDIWGQTFNHAILCTGQKNKLKTIAR